MMQNMRTIPAARPCVLAQPLVSVPACRRAATSSPVACPAVAAPAATSTTSNATMTRKGFAVADQGVELKPWNYEVGPLGAQEVDIKVICNGLCHTDMSMKDNEWGLSKYPFIPGHEVVGIVQAVGNGVRGLAPGQRVGVGWIADSCRCCQACVRGNENVCVKGYRGLIVMGNHGGFQDVLRAPADFTYPLPEGLDSVSAAPLLCAGVTVYAPLRKYNRFPGMHVAILGVGGLGHLGVQFAAALGHSVTAIDVDPSKAKEADKLGADAFVTFNDATASGPQSRANTFDLIINCASGKIDTGKLLDMLKPDGSLVQVGIPGGAVMQVPLQNLVFGQKTVAGSIVGGRADMLEMLQVAASKGVRPMVETFPLAKVNEAIDYVHSGKVRYRVVLLTEGFDPKSEKTYVKPVAEH